LKSDPYSPVFSKAPALLREAGAFFLFISLGFIEKMLFLAASFVMSSGSSCQIFGFIHITAFPFYCRFHHSLFRVLHFQKQYVMIARVFNRNTFLETKQKI